MLSNLIDEIIAAYRINPRNKIFIDEKILLASAIEESGNQISINQLLYLGWNILLKVIK
jgi:hypothetical protein